ncbi:MAG: InlB B-repeat-containing protein, partial [Methanimicrococcus sp.]|nr:InlB B-repeat-containing protein [Methanimicrococcus sp.]
MKEHLVNRLFTIMIVIMMVTGTFGTTIVAAEDENGSIGTGSFTAYWYQVSYDEFGQPSERLIGSQDFSGIAGESDEIHYTDRDDNAFKFAGGVNSFNFEWSSFKIDNSKSSDRYFVIYGLTGDVRFYITYDNDAPVAIEEENLTANSEPPMPRGRSGNTITINVYQITTKIDNTVPHRNLSITPDAAFPFAYYNWGMKKVDRLYRTYEIEWDGSPVTVNAADYQVQAQMGNWLLNPTYDPTVTNTTTTHGPASPATVTVDSPGEVNFYFDAPDWEYSRDGVGLGSSLLSTPLSNEAIVYNTRGMYELTSINMTTGYASAANAGRTNTHITYIWLGSDINQNELRNRLSSAEPTTIMPIYVGNPLFNRNKRNLTFNGAVDRSEGRNVNVGDQSTRDDDWHKWVQYFCVISNYSVNHYVMRTNTNTANRLDLTIENAYIIGGNRGFINSGGTNYGTNMTYRNVFYIGPQLMMDNRSIVTLDDVEIVINDPRYGGTNTSSELNEGLGIGGTLSYEDVNRVEHNITLNMNDRTALASCAWGQALAVGRVEFKNNVTVYKTNPRGSARAQGPMMFQIGNDSTTASMGARPNYIIHDHSNINLRYNTLRDGAGQANYSVFGGEAAGAGETPHVIIGNFSTMNVLVDNKFNADTLGDFTVGDFCTVNVISTGDGDPSSTSSGAFIRFGNKFTVGNSSVVTVHIQNRNNYTSVHFRDVELRDRSKLTIYGNTGTATNTTSRMVNFTSDFRVNYGAEVRLINHGHSSVIQTGNLTVDKLAVLHVIGMNTTAANPVINSSRGIIDIDRAADVTIYHGNNGRPFFQPLPAAGNTYNLTLNGNRVNQTNFRVTNMERIEYWNHTSTARYDYDTWEITGDPTSEWAIDWNLGRGFGFLARYGGGAAAAAGTIPTFAAGNFTTENYINRTTSPNDFTVLDEPGVLQTLTSANIAYRDQRIVSYKGLVGPYDILFTWRETPWDPTNETVNTVNRGAVRYDMTIMNDVPNLYADAPNPVNFHETLEQLMPKNPETGENYYDRGFAHWLDNNGVFYDVEEREVKQKVELFGVWEFYPTYYKNFPGDDEKITVNVSLGTNHVIEQNTFTQDGYRFVGWNDKSDGSGSNIPPGTMMGLYTRPAYYYAQWELIEYNITYHNVFASEHQNPATYNVTSEFLFEDPERFGHIFEGWYNDSLLTIPITGVEAGTTGDINVYAKLTELLFDVTYDPNGGTGGPGTEFAIPIQPAYLLKQSPKPSHASAMHNGVSTSVVFAGWSLSPVADILTKDDEPLLDLAEVKTVNILDDDVTVYAIWGFDTTGNNVPDVGDVKYNISYNLNGGEFGTGPEPDMNIPVQNNYVLKDMPRPTHLPVDKEGDNVMVNVVFVGWINESSLPTSKILTSADESYLTTLISTVNVTNSDVTVYALWGYDSTGNGVPDVVDDRYNVHYNQNGGTGGPIIDSNVPVQDDYPLRFTPEPTHVNGTFRGMSTSVVFAGWSAAPHTQILTKDDGDILESLEITTVNIVNDNVTVYAIWGFDSTGNDIPDVDDESYNITYNFVGGTGGPPIDTNIPVQDAYVLLREPMPMRGPELLNGTPTPVAFAYWTLSDTNLGKVYARGETLPTRSDTVAVAGDMTVYAVWGFDTTSTGTPDITDAEFDVYYELNGGTGGPFPNPERVTEQPFYALSTNEPTRLNEMHNGKDTPVVFAFWTLNDTTVGKIYARGEALPAESATVAVSDNMTVYAVWGYDTTGTGTPDITDIERELRYNLNGGLAGTGPTPNPVMVTEQPAYALNLEQKPTRFPVLYQGEQTPVVFAYWTLDNSTLGVIHEFNTPLPLRSDEISITADVTVYAVWGYDTTGTGTPDINDPMHELTYDLNGGIVNTGPTPNPVMVLEQEYYMLSEDEPDHADVLYLGNPTPVVFAYWTLDDSAIGEIYAYGDTLPDEESVISVMDDVTVYAVWGYDTTNTGTPDITDPVYELTYHLNGGTANTGPYPNPVTVTVQSAYLLSTDAPSRAPVDKEGDGVLVNVSFVGWSTALYGLILTKDDTPPSSWTDTVAISGDTTVYAIWGYDTAGTGTPDVIAVRYDVHYDPNGGTGGPGTDTNIPVQNGYTLSTYPEPTRDPFDKEGDGVLIDVVFAGWSTTPHAAILTKDDTFPASWTETVDIVDDEVTVYALWGYDTSGSGIPDFNDEKYDIYYNTGSGTGGPVRDTNIPVQDDYVLTTTPKPMHDPVDKESDGVMVPVAFAGWSMTPHAAILTKDDTLPASWITTVDIVDADVTVYALWGFDSTNSGTPDINDIKFDVYYNTGSGTGGPGMDTNVSVQFGYTLRTTPKPMHDPVDKESDGVMVPVSFAGWSMTPHAAILTKDDTLPASWIEMIDIVDADVTVYALWGYDSTNSGTPDINDIKFDVYYDTGSGTGGPGMDTNVSVQFGYTLRTTPKPMHDPVDKESDGVMVPVSFAGWSITQHSAILT